MIMKMMMMMMKMMVLMMMMTLTSPVRPRWTTTVAAWSRSATASSAGLRDSGDTTGITLPLYSYFNGTLMISYRYYTGILLVL